MSDDLRAAVAEFVGTFFLLAAVVGSGIMATRLTDEPGLQLFLNAFATAGVLTALILALQPASGAHFNPAVSLADRLLGGIDNARLALFVPAQLLGGALGVVVANLMFELDPITLSETERSGAHLLLAEGVATFGLLLVIFGVVRGRRPETAAWSVGGYIGGAYFFTASTSFANPAVTVARMLSDTYAGIEPASVLPFVVVQLVAAPALVAVIRIAYPD